MTTRTRTKKTTPSTIPTPLTVDDLIGGGRVVRETFVPDLDRTVHYRSVSAGRALELMNIEVDEKNQFKVISEMIDVLVDVLCNKDGSTLITREQLLNVPMDKVRSLMQAVSGLGGGGDDAAKT